MRKSITTIVATLGVVALITGIYSFTSPQAAKAVEGGEFMQITTVESIIPGGLGRSRMFITDPSGKMEEKKMKNFYSLAGINMGNINVNDALILNTLNSYQKEGWTVYNVTAGVQSPSGGDGGNQGIYLTRYLLQK